jgi:hypothetical protein
VVPHTSGAAEPDLWFERRSAAGMTTLAHGAELRPWSFSVA